jgi:hypothetical protein
MDGLGEVGVTVVGAGPDCVVGGLDILSLVAYIYI